MQVKSITQGLALREHLIKDSCGIFLGHVEWLALARAPVPSVHLQIEVHIECAFGERKWEK